PTKSFGGNAAWLVLNTIAHNLTRWTARLGMHLARVATKTIRRKIYTVGARLTRTARRLHLHLPSAWPWADTLLTALDRIRALPAPTG
ncbi:transposase, partial [Micromonospora sp. NPDC050495]|uniref:transposase n=1 Tax=Micromonospora sp. NPDC050495 TaxID=3154936 RepID=UPI0033F7DB07